MLAESVISDTKFYFYFRRRHFELKLKKNKNINLQNVLKTMLANLYNNEFCG